MLYRGQYHYNALWRVECEICSTADPFDLRCESVTVVTWGALHMSYVMTVAASLVDTFLIDS